MNLKTFFLPKGNQKSKIYYFVKSLFGRVIFYVCDIWYFLPFTSHKRHHLQVSNKFICLQVSVCQCGEIAEHSYVHSNKNTSDCVYAQVELAMVLSETNVTKPVFSWHQFTLLNWPDSDSDFAQVRVRVSVRVSDPTQSQSQVSLKKAGSGKHWTKRY